MPYSQAAINFKNKCPERALPRPRRLPRCQDRHARRTRCRRRRLQVRRLSLFVVAKSPSPGKDHALGRRTRGTALHALVAAGPGGPKPNTATAAVLTSMKRAIIAAALAISVLGGSVAPVRADFRLCNNSASRVSVSLAYTDGETWVSEGWWNLKPSGCETLVRGALAAEYYYVYAMDEHGGEWKGKAFMCTRDREFRIIGREDCFVRGFDRTGFFEVDTGKEAKNWTVQLTDSTQGPPSPQ
jgi:uncharacterized membrane protein